jgi:sugar phosphate permease
MSPRVERGSPATVCAGLISRPICRILAQSEDMEENRETSSSGATVCGQRYRWVVLASACAMYTISFADRVNVSIVLPLLRKEFGLTNMQAGELASMYFVGYIIAMLPVGFLLGKTGVRSLIGFAILGFSFCTCVIGAAASAVQILWARVALGVAESPVPTGGATLIKSWFPRKEQAIAAGYFMSASVLGQLIVPPVAVWIASNMGWRYVFFCFAVPGVVMAVLWWFLVADRPTLSRFCSQRERDYIAAGQISHGPALSRPGPKRLWATRFVDAFLRRHPVRTIDGVRELFLSRNAWGVALGFCGTCAIAMGMVFWIPAFLVDGKGMVFSGMGWVATAMPLGGMAGCVVGGYLSDVLLEHRRKFNMLLSPASVIVLLYALMRVPNRPTMLFGVLFLIGLLLYSAWSCYYAYLMSIVSSRVAPVAIAFMTCVGNLGGFVTPIIAGRLLDVYKSYNFVFMFFAAWAVVSFLCILCVREPADDSSPGA